MVTHALAAMLRAIAIAAGLLASAAAGAVSPSLAQALAQAQVLFEQQRYAEAVSALEPAARSDATDAADAAAFLLLGKAYGRLAERQPWHLAAVSARRCGRALERAVELDPRNREALSALERFYSQAPAILGGGADKAAAVRERLLALD